MCKKITVIELFSFLISAAALIISGWTYFLNVKTQDTNEKTLAKELQHQKYEFMKELSDAYIESVKARIIYVSSLRELYEADLMVLKDFDNSFNKMNNYIPKKSKVKYSRHYKRNTKNVTSDLYESKLLLIFYNKLIIAQRDLQLFCVIRPGIQQKLNQFSYLGLPNQKNLIKSLNNDKWCDTQKHNIGLFEAAIEGMSTPSEFQGIYSGLQEEAKEMPSWIFDLEAYLTLGK